MAKKHQEPTEADALRERIRQLQTQVAELRNERDAESAAQLRALRATNDRHCITITALRAELAAAKAAL